MCIFVTVTNQPNVMSNMSYCRFQNTALDLDDCNDALADPSEIDDLSRDEQRAMVRMADLALTYLENLTEHISCLTPEQLQDLDIDTTDITERCEELAEQANQL
jgi:hypothetical protein